MKKQELYNKVIAYFQEAMPVAETELHYNNPFELLIAVILSQCTVTNHWVWPSPSFSSHITPLIYYVETTTSKHVERMAQSW